MSKHPVPHKGAFASTYARLTNRARPRPDQPQPWVQRARDHGPVSPVTLLA